MFFHAEHYSRMREDPFVYCREGLRKGRGKLRVLTIDQRPYFAFGDALWQHLLVFPWGPLLFFRGEPSASCGGWGGSGETKEVYEAGN